MMKEVLFESPQIGQLHTMNGQGTYFDFHCKAIASFVSFYIPYCHLILRTLTCLQKWALQWWLSLKQKVTIPNKDSKAAIRQTFDLHCHSCLVLYSISMSYVRTLRNNAVLYVVKAVFVLCSGACQSMLYCLSIMMLKKCRNIFIFV